MNIRLVQARPESSPSHDYNHESFAQDAGGAGTFTGKGEGAGDWADRRAGARPDGVDLWDRSTYIWMGSVVAGADQAAGDARA